MTNQRNDEREGLKEIAAASGRDLSELNLFAAELCADLTTRLGFSDEEAVNLADDLVRLSVDLASFNAIPVEEVYNRLRGAIAFDLAPLALLGIVVNRAGIGMRAAKEGTWDFMQDQIDPVVEFRTLWSIIRDQTTYAQGDALRIANAER